MNIHEYISSGILETYVLGAATPEERMEVEKYSAQYPEIKQEIEEIEEAMNIYATMQSIQSPVHIKEKILAEISGKTTSADSVTEPIVRTLNQPKASKSTSYYWSVAATLLLLVSTSFAIYLGVRNTALKGYMDRIANVNNSLADSIHNVAKANSAMSDSMKSVAANLTQMKNDMAILKDPMYKVVELKGLKPAPDAKAMICWCPSEKKVYLEVDKLPAAPKGMQYQLWAIVGGKPISEGMLGPGIGLHRMPDVDKAQAFAITLEKEGGSPTPTMDAMYVMGTT